jgi:hypothetical protein
VFAMAFAWAPAVLPALAALGVCARLPGDHRRLGRLLGHPGVAEPGEVGRSTGEVEAFGIAASHGGRCPVRRAT